ncbi:MAG: hypothetical protein ACI4FZ_01840 [Lachnospiraceae bacterium]
MPANTDIKKMELLFHRVAAYRGLILSGYVLSCLLALSFLVLVFTEYKTPAPLYLLFLYSVLPYLLRTLLTQSSNGTHQKKEETVCDIFPLFCQKYHYSALRHTAAGISYLIAFFLLCAWSFSYVLHPGKPVLVSRIPICIAAVSLLVRLSCTVCYRIYFRRNPLRAMH